MRDGDEERPKPGLGLAIRLVVVEGIKALGYAYVPVRADLR